MSLMAALRECTGLQGSPLWQHLLFLTGMALMMGLAAYLVRLLLVRCGDLDVAPLIIDVDPHFKGNMAWFEVTTRHKADVAATIRLLGIELIPPDMKTSYDVKWKDAPNAKSVHLIPKTPYVIEIARSKGTGSNSSEGADIFTAGGTKNGVVIRGSTVRCEIEAHTTLSVQQGFKAMYVLRIDQETHEWADFYREKVGMKES